MSDKENINETPITRRYWENIGGTLIEEFCLVEQSKSEGCQSRKVDGIILPSVPFINLPGLGSKNRWHWDCFTKQVDPNGAFKNILKNSLKHQEVIVVQTKASQLGFCLMGQAIFSSRLVKKRFDPKCVHSIALCGATHEQLQLLLDNFFEVKLVIDKKATKKNKHGHLQPAMDVEEEHGVKFRPDVIDLYWKTILKRGTRIFHYGLTDVHTAHAVILLDEDYKEGMPNQYPSLKGEILILTTRAKTKGKPEKSRERAGMCSLGRAYFSAELLRRKHPDSIVKSYALCEEPDYALLPLLDDEIFSRVKVEPFPYYNHLRK